MNAIHLTLPMTILLTLAVQAAEPVPIRVGDKDLVFYQATPLSNPEGGARFQGSNFIHPLKTPSGFVVTEIQPPDHLHHFGLWWPWKFIEVDGRKILCWELQRNDGLIRAVDATRAEPGLVTRSEYIDRKAPGGPVTRLHETTTITVSETMDRPARGYFLDLEITHRTAGDRPITVTPYRYSGLALRATAAWDRDTSTILTSEGKGRDEANFSPARWILAQGAAGEAGTAGVLMMSRPDNHGHPEKLRTWDRQHHGAVFINFNPVMDDPWVFAPDTDYTRNYRLFVFDGTLSAQDAESLWAEYTGTPAAPAR